MNVTRLKKGCLLIVAVLMVYAFLPAACAAAESGEIPVTEQTFPDPAGCWMKRIWTAREAMES